MKELDANDRPFIESTLSLLERTDVEAFFLKYRDRFESQAQFESGLSEFRKAAADLQLEGDIPSALLADAGGYKKFTEAIDKIGADPDAKASLDKLFIVTENLNKSGQPVLNILDQVKSGVKS